MKTSSELKTFVINYQHGDREAFNGIYELSYKYLHTCVIHVVKNEDAAMDMLQETYMEISRSIFQLQKPDDFLSWAAVIANRKCFAYLKKQKDVLLYSDDESEDEDGNFFDTLADDEAFIPEEILQDREKQRLFREIIDSLSDMQRLCVIGYYYNEQKQDEIAEELGIPVNTVKTNLSRAKAKIKEALVDLDVKKGTRLYSFAPFIFLLLGEEAEACTVPAMSETLQGTATVHAEKALAKNAMDSTIKSVAKNSGQTAGKAAGIGMKIKIAVVFTGIILLGGVAALLMMNRKPDLKEETVIEEIADVEQDPENKESITDLGTGDSETKEEDADNAEDIVQGLEATLPISPQYDIVTAKDGLAIVLDTDVRKYGAITYENEIVVPAEYDECCKSINNDGQFFLVKGDQYIVFDREGNEIYESAERIEAVSDGVVFHKSEISDMEEFSFKYVKFDGTILFEKDTNIYSTVGGVPFNEGKAILNDDCSTHVMELDGSRMNLFEKQYPLWHTGREAPSSSSHDGIQIIVNSAGTDVDMTYPIGVCCNGYFMERSIPYLEDTFDAYSIQTIDGSLDCAFEITYLAERLGFDAENVLWTIRGFEVNGCTSYNYGTLFSLHLTDGENVGDYLIDVSKRIKKEEEFWYTYEYTDEMFLLKGEYIEVSKEKYWLYNNEGKWGYIDHDGNVIAMYEDACSFVNGKAMVLIDGKAYFIDENMNVTGEGIPALAVSKCGDLFRVSTMDGTLYLQSNRN